MKKSEIQIGKTYRGGKTGSLRQVFDLIDIGSYVGESVDVLYTHESGRLKGNTGCMRLPSFARWAKEELEETLDRHADQSFW